VGLPSRLAVVGVPAGLEVVGLPARLALVGVQARLAVLGVLARLAVLGVLARLAVLGVPAGLQPVVCEAPQRLPPVQGGPLKQHMTWLPLSWRPLFLWMSPLWARQ